MIRNILAVFTAACLIASVAVGAEVDTNITGTPSNSEVLFTFTGTVDTDDECLNLDGAHADGAAGTTAACDAVVNTVVVPADAKVTKISTVVRVAGDAGYGCIVTPEIDGAAAMTATTLATDAAAASITETAQRTKLEAGDLLGISVLDGLAALVCAGTTDPQFEVRVYGYWLVE